MTVKQAESMRITIDTVFRQKYAKTYTYDKLNGTDGVVQSICRDIHYFQPTTVRRVVIQSYIDIQNEREYDAKKKKYTRESKRKIQQGTYEHHLLTVLKEGNNSFSQCTEALNSLHYAMEELPPVGITAIHNAINWCNFEKVKTKKIMQTNIKNLTYRQARYNWLAQLLARMGVDIPDNDGSDVRANLKDEWIDYRTLKEKGLTFDLDQVAFWDECHIKQVAGTCFDETLVFARDEDGIYDKDTEVDVEANEKVSIKEHDSLLLPYSFTSFITNITTNFHHFRHSLLFLPPTLLPLLPSFRPENISNLNRKPESVLVFVCVRKKGSH